MNKNEKAMNKLSSQLMKSINFYYNENKSNIEYEEYIFNDFEVSDITYNGFSINFYIVNEENINNDLKNTELIIENRIENKDKNFEQIYKGKYYKITAIQGLFPNTNYEFRFYFFQ